jgi:dienelactone hydrolase
MKGLLLAAAGILLALAGVQAAEKAPGTGPWDVKALQKTPSFELKNPQEVREGEAVVALSEVYYAGEPWMAKPTRVFGYYARPTAAPGGTLPKKSLPAMVLVHGGGGTAFPQWARLWAARGYAALAMDLSGCGPERKRLEDGGPDQGDEWKFKHLKDGVKNAWPYYAIAAVLRGASVLAAQPEVDPKRLGITGISWGGYLTSIAMSLDDRFRAAIPVYGCGYLHENSVWVPLLNSLPPDERQTWVATFDPSAYLPRCKIPVLWMNGTNDFAYPLDSYQKSYRAVRGPRTLCVTVKMPHSHEAGWARPEIARFADAYLRGGRPLGRVGPTTVQAGRVTAAYDSPTALLKTQVHWTTELDKPWQQRDWQTANGRVIGLRGVEGTLPDTRPLVYFMTLTDAQGQVISTDHALLGDAPASK